jgi:hypothetical protein
VKRLLAWASGQGVEGKALLVIVAVFLAVVLIGTGHHLIGALRETERDRGAVEERAAHQAGVIENVAKAKEAARDFKRDPDGNLPDCVLDARNSEDC